MKKANLRDAIVCNFKAGKNKILRKLIFKSWNTDSNFVYDVSVVKASGIDVMTIQLHNFRLFRDLIYIV